MCWGSGKSLYLPFNFVRSKRSFWDFYHLSSLLGQMDVFLFLECSERRVLKITMNGKRTSSRDW